MTEMFGEAWSPMSVPDLAPDDDDAIIQCLILCHVILNRVRPKQIATDLQQAL